MDRRRGHRTPYKMSTSYFSHLPFRPFLPIVLLPVLVLTSASYALSPNDQQVFADGLYARGMYGLAIDEYLKISRSTPEYERIDAVLYRLAESYRKTGDSAIAARYYFRVIKEIPDSEFRHRSLLRRAEILIEDGKHAQAIKDLGVLIGEKPDPALEAAAFYYKGTAHRKKRAPAAARKEFKKLLKEHPASPFVSFAALELGELLQVKKPAEAAGYYRLLSEKTSTPRLAAEGLFRLGELFFKQKEYKESAEAFERLLKNHGTDLRAAEALLPSAWARFYDGDYKGVLALSEGRQEGEGGAEWVYLRANSFRQLNRGDEAVKTYASLRARFPDHPYAESAAFESALMAHEAGRYEDVLSQLKGLAPSKKIAVDYHWLSGEAQDALGNGDQALTSFGKILDSQPDHPRAASALFRMGEIRQALGKHAPAIVAFRKIIADYGESGLAPNALLASAYGHQKLDKPEEAMADWNYLLEAYPKDELAEEALYQKGLEELRLENDALALSTLTRYTELYPEAPRLGEVYYWLAGLSEKEEKWSDAEELLRNSISSSVDPRIISKAEYRLASVLQREGRSDEAAALLQGLLEANASAEMPPALIDWLVRFQVEAGEYKKGLKAADLLSERAITEAWRQIGKYWQGVCTQNLGDDASAIKYYSVALTRETQTREGVDAAIRLGNLQLEAGDGESAGQAFSTAAEWAAGDDLTDLRGKSYYGLAKAAGLRGDKDEAARYYMSVAILFDDPLLSPECLYRAAETYKDLNRAEDQQKALAELSERYPDSEWAMKIRVRITESGP